MRRRRWRIVCVVHLKRFGTFPILSNYSNVSGTLSNNVCIYGKFPLKMTKFDEHFTSKEFVYRTGSSKPRSAATLKALVEKIERMSKLINSILVKSITASLLVTPLLVTFINYVILGMGNESFRFDGTFWFPFDPNEPIGFFMALLFQCVTIFADFCFYRPIVCILIGSCWSIITFLRDIARDLSHLSKEKIENLQRQELTERFCNFVRFHADVQELSVDTFFLSHEICVQNIDHFRLTGEFSDNYEFIAFIMFIWGLITIASSLITFQAVEQPHEFFIFKKKLINCSSCSQWAARIQLKFSCQYA